MIFFSFMQGVYKELINLLLEVYNKISLVILQIYDAPLRRFSILLKKTSLAKLQVRCIKSGSQVFWLFFQIWLKKQVHLRTYQNISRSIRNMIGFWFIFMRTCREWTISYTYERRPLVHLQRQSNRNRMRLFTFLSGLDCPGWLYLYCIDRLKKSYK